MVGNDGINYTEFVAAAMSMKHYDQEGLCWAPFRAFDTNGDEIITPAELTETLGAHVDDIEVRKIFNHVDQNQRGMIRFDDFLAMMRKLPDSSDKLDDMPGPRLTFDRTFESFHDLEIAELE